MPYLPLLDFSGIYLATPDHARVLERSSMPCLSIGARGCHEQRMLVPETTCRFYSISANPAGARDAPDAFPFV